MNCHSDEVVTEGGCASNVDNETKTNEKKNEEEERRARKEHRTCAPVRRVFRDQYSRQFDRPDAKQLRPIYILRSYTLFFRREEREPGRVQKASERRQNCSYLLGNEKLFFHFLRIPLARVGFPADGALARKSVRGPGGARRWIICSASCDTASGSAAVEQPECFFALCVSLKDSPEPRLISAVCFSFGFYLRDLKTALS